MKLIVCKISDTCLFERIKVVDIALDAKTLKNYIDRDSWHNYKTVAFIRADGTMIAEFRKYGQSYLLYDTDIPPGNFKYAAEVAYPGRAYKFEREAHIIKRK